LEGRDVVVVDVVGIAGVVDLIVIDQAPVRHRTVSLHVVVLSRAQKWQRRRGLRE
jgi:hypothetical protein